MHVLVCADYLRPHSMSNSSEISRVPFVGWTKITKLKSSKAMILHQMELQKGLEFLFYMLFCFFVLFYLYFFNSCCSLNIELHSHFLTEIWYLLSHDFRTSSHLETTQSLDTCLAGQFHLKFPYWSLLKGRQSRNYMRNISSSKICLCHLTSWEKHWRSFTKN